MGRFEEYVFDVTRLWDEPVSATNKATPARLTKRTRPPRTAAAEVVRFPQSAKITRADETSVNVAACRKRTRADLRSIAMSLKLRDMLLRNGIADRCAKCAKCPSMVG